MQNNIILKTDLQGLKLFKRGKVRDVYDFGENLLIVASDRISAFDVVLPNGIPNKGMVLTQVSNFWFNYTKDIIPNHCVSVNTNSFPMECEQYKNILDGRSMLVKKTKSLPVECVIRGCLSGSAWKEYCSNNTVSGIKLEKGLLESSKLSEPIFTPSTKAQDGAHDENINFNQMVNIIGKELAEKIRVLSLRVYIKASKFAQEKGIIIADTKFEFGIYNGELMIIDEMLTPDSSRFWQKDEYKTGDSPKSFDKQFVRDYLISIKWDMKPPAPELPEEVINKTSEKYMEALKRLTG
ncbi:MAG: phosphoribosylaminoimidazolesuccinocarboxamide synthase [Candidatus Firestonebacteria bacterium]